MTGTYTLDQLARLNATGTNKDFVWQAYKQEIVSGEVRVLLLNYGRSESCNFVGISHDYHDVYGAELLKYVDYFLVQNQVPNDDGPRHTLGQLAWIAMTGMFPGDLIEDMVELGYTNLTAAILCEACRDAEGDVIAMWVSLRDRLPAEVQQYFVHCLKSYPANWPSNTESNINREKS